MVCATTRYVDNKTSTISKTFILTNKNSTFTGIRDPRNSCYFLLNEVVIYRNGKREFITHRLSENQVNCLFHSLDTDNFRDCMSPDVYITDR